jgi:hypothetical protein
MGARVLSKDLERPILFFFSSASVWTS